MTIDEAIKIQRKQLALDNPPMGTDHRAAVLMGIEALKREQIFRREVPDGLYNQLPGETPEETAASHET